MPVVAALILAAGAGTRFRSDLSKLRHPVAGLPMIAWPVIAAADAGVQRTVLVVSSDDDFADLVPAEVERAVQSHRDGTGGAVRAATERLGGVDTVVVYCGDNAAITSDVISDLIAVHHEGDHAATMATMILDDPTGYGRVVRDRDGQFEHVVETKSEHDHDPEHLEIHEVNSGVYVFDVSALLQCLELLTDETGQGEYYLPAVLPLLRQRSLSVAAHLHRDASALLGVNTRADLARAEAVVRGRINTAHGRAGVTIRDPESTWIDADVELAADVTIEPGTTLRGATSVGAGSAIGPHATLIDARIGERAHIPHSYLTGCEVGDDVQVGPFAYLRPGTRLAAGAKAGTFVEIKGSRIGEGAKVPHLAYVGDAEIGAGANLGAGSITANYDGFAKHRTKIGERARIGVNNSLVAPVDVGDDAYTGAGAVIRKDVPPGGLGVSKVQQRNIEGYAERKKRESEGD